MNYKELKYFGRYRDDCLALWIGTEEKLNLFFEYINSLNPDLKFTMEVGGKELCFLDVNISIVDNMLQTTVYSKPTDSHLYLHATSCHNRATVNGIPKGVALRLRRLCSTDQEYDIQSEQYQRHLELRGYKRDLVEKAFNDNRKKSRENARFLKGQKSVNQPVIFSTKFNPRGPDVKAIVNRHLPFINNTPVLKDLIPSGTIMVASKRESSLADLLQRSDPYNVKTDLTDDQKHGYTKCNKNCDSCNNFVTPTDTITSFATGRTFTIRRDSTCTTKNVIYVAICQTCGKQGVGSTVAWKPRLANYKSHIKKEVRTCRIVRHFIEDCPDTNLQNLKFIIVNVVTNTDYLSKETVETLLLEKEKFWIGTLITQHKGLNGSHDWNRRKRTERENLS